jgi:unspecific monooxygenase
MKALVLQDRFFGNLIVEQDGGSPYPLLEKLRSKGSILRTYMVNGWSVVSHEDVQALLRDKRLSSEVFQNRLLQRVIRASTRGLVAPLIDYPSMLNLDAPSHTRLRKLTSKSFTNRFVQSLSPKIEQIVKGLLVTVEGHSSFDLMEVIAKPLPAIVIAEMLGVPSEERHLFEAWSSDLLGYTEILDADAIHGAAQGDLAMRAYLRDLVDYKRTQPGRDLISSMIEAEESDEKLSIDDLLSTCTLLLVAGHETPT